MTNEVLPQDSNDTNKNKEHENVCPLPFNRKKNMFQQQPFIMSGLGLEHIQELIIVESIH